MDWKYQYKFIRLILVTHMHIYQPPSHTHPSPPRGNYYLEFKAYYTHAWLLAFIHTYVFLNNIQQFSTYLSVGTWIASNLSLLQVTFPHYKWHCSVILV